MSTLPCVTSHLNIALDPAGKAAQRRGAERAGAPPPRYPHPPPSKGKGKGHVFTLHLKNSSGEGSRRGASCPFHAEHSAFLQAPFTSQGLRPERGRPVQAQSKALTVQEGSRTPVPTYRCAQGSVSAARGCTERLEDGTPLCMTSTPSDPTIPVQEDAISPPFRACRGASSP